MKSTIKTAKTVDDAINKAIDELNVEKEDVSVEIIDVPSKGIFGFIGVKDAKVKVTVEKKPDKVAYEFLKEIIQKISIDAEPKIKVTGNKMFIDIKGKNEKDMGVVIGKRGRTLDSIQYLISLVVNKDRDKYMKVILDTENYRKKREETLKRLAKKMASKAKQFKKNVKLEPMNPYERRIIHSALQRDPYINTYSEGEDPNRRVVIEYK